MDNDYKKRGDTRSIIKTNAISSILICAIAEKGKPGESRGRKAYESKARKGHDGRVASVGSIYDPFLAAPQGVFLLLRFLLKGVTNNVLLED